MKVSYPHITINKKTYFAISIKYLFIKTPLYLTL